MSGDFVIFPYFDVAFTSFVTFLVILDPPGAAVVFVALTGAMPSAKRRAIAWKASLIAGAILLLFALTGRMWFMALGIGLPAFRTAGGLLLFLLAVQMVFGRLTERCGVADVEASARGEDIAGPGTMTSVVLLMSRADGDPIQGLVIVVMLLAALAIMLVSLLQAGLMARVLRVTGSDVIARLMAINLAALAVQFIVDGLHDTLLQWGLKL